MTTKQAEVDFPEVQAAIYRVALSLDSFLINGIPYGVIHQEIVNGFLQKVVRILLGELTNLEAHASNAPEPRRPHIMDALAALRARCQELIDLVDELRSFRILPLQRLRSIVARIPPLRAECVQRIQELEGQFRTPRPFYQTRPAHSTAAVNDFLANLERVFLDERGNGDI